MSLTSFLAGESAGRNAEIIRSAGLMIDRDRAIEDANAAYCAVIFPLMSAHQIPTQAAQPLPPMKLDPDSPLARLAAGKPAKR